jgi:2',3'-cyclic-nucleotide 2'-phosphodiesterase (5'-nucleotidase family)
MKGLISGTALTGLVLCAAAVAAAFQAGGSSPQPEKDRTAILLAINDVYRIEGTDGGLAGGLARVRALRKELERESPDLLLLHAGDFLFPSFLSRMYRGEQMIAAMNALDGDSGAFDPRMFVTFGNHEFERPRLSDASLLEERIETSQFHWLASNITFAKGPDGNSAIASKNLSRSALIESGGIRIGIFGLTLQTTGIEYVAEFSGELETARTLSARLRADGAEVVVALTHLNASADRRLLETLGDEGPDVVIGGHDHEAMATKVKGRFLLKADSDAKSANVVRLTRKADGALLVTSELRTLALNSPTPDPQMDQLALEWRARHAREFCALEKAPPGCLDEAYGHTRTELVAEESKIRGRETSLGNWVADRMLEAFRSCGAQVAFINSGSLRLNRDLPAGAKLTRRHVEELLAYKTPLYLLRIDGAALMKVAEQSVRGWPGSGSWLQIAGFAFRHETTRREASDLTWLTAGPSRRVEKNEPVLAVVGDYLINPDIGDQDGYQMLNRAQIVATCAKNGADLKAVVVEELKAREPGGIGPRFEGRICQGVQGAPCLVSPS